MIVVRENIFSLPRFGDNENDINRDMDGLANGRERALSVSGSATHPLIRPDTVSLSAVLAS